MEKPQVPWTEMYHGKLFLVEQHPEKGFERAVRPPGVRLILQNSDGLYLITKEFRAEKGEFDYRLPGGKVFDDLDSFLEVRRNDDAMNKAILQAAALEAKQEAGIDTIDDLVILSKSVAGASVEWDLYYLTGTIKDMSDQALDGDEAHHGIEVGFYSKEQVLGMLYSGQITEDRSIGVLFKHLGK